MCADRKPTCSQGRRRIKDGGHRSKAVSPIGLTGCGAIQMSMTSSVVVAAVRRGDCSALLIEVEFFDPYHSLNSRQLVCTCMGSGDEGFALALLFDAEELDLLEDHRRSDHRRARSQADGTAVRYRGLVSGGDDVAQVANLDRSELAASLRLPAAVLDVDLEDPHGIADAASAIPSLLTHHEGSHVRPASACASPGAAQRCDAQREFEPLFVSGLQKHALQFGGGRIGSRS